VLSSSRRKRRGLLARSNRLSGRYAALSRTSVEACRRDATISAHIISFFPDVPGALLIELFTTKVRAP